MLRHARVAAEWVNAPTPEQIRAQDRERLMQVLLQPLEFDEEDHDMAQRLLAGVAHALKVLQ